MTHRRIDRDLVDVILPTAAELAQEEAELQAMSAAPEPLPARLVERLVGTAIVSKGLDRRGQFPRKRRWLLASMLTVTLASLGWIGSQTLWLEQDLSPLTLDYRSAVLATTNPEYSDHNHVTAIAVVDEHVAHCLKALDKMALATLPAELVDQLAALRSDLGHAIVDPVTAPPAPVTTDILATLAEVTDPAAPMTERSQALNRLGAAMRSGLQGIRICTEQHLEVPIEVEKARFAVDRLIDDLGARGLTPPGSRGLTSPGS